MLPVDLLLTLKMSNRDFLSMIIEIQTPTLTVKVQNSATDSTTTTYTVTTDIAAINGTNEVYFLQEVEVESLKYTLVMELLVKH